MAEALILEFDGIGRKEYEAVNAQLNIDPVAGGGDWPEGLLHHAGGVKPGGLVVFEIWESKEHHARFMENRLGPALQAGGVSAPPTRVEWLELVGDARPGA